MNTRILRMRAGRITEYSAIEYNAERLTIATDRVRVVLASVPPYRPASMHRSRLRLSIHQDAEAAFRRLVQALIQDDPFIIAEAQYAFCMTRRRIEQTQRERQEALQLTAKHNREKALRQNEEREHKARRHQNIAAHQAFRPPPRRRKIR